MSKRVSLSERKVPTKTATAPALISGVPQDGLVMISPRELEPNPYQPRRGFDEEKLQELAASIVQDGVIEPLVVRVRGRGKYQIIAGERRWKAAQIAKLTQVPAIIKDCSDEEMELLALEENLHREDLNTMDRSRALSSVREKRGLTWEQLGQRVGLSRRRVLMLAGLQDLPEDIQEQIAQGALTEKHGRALGRLGDAQQQRQLAQVIQREQLSGDQAIAAVRLLHKEPGQDIEPAVRAVAGSSAPGRRTSRAAAQFRKTLGAVEPQRLTAAERSSLAGDLMALTAAIQQLVEQLKQESKP